jgi:Ca-activated chloride channel family protein
MSQLYGNQERYVLLEVDLPAGDAGTSRPVADVAVRYGDLLSPSPSVLTGQVAVAYTGSAEDVEERADRSALVEVVKQVAAEASEKAVELRDMGRVEDARELLQENASYLMESAEQLQAPELQGYGEAANRAASNLDEDSWNAERKQMRSEQYSTQNQQSY